jgi:PAS domain-containing protein
MPVASCGNSDPRCPTHSPETKTAMKNPILAAATTAVLFATTHLSPAADTAAEPLEVITSAMNSIPDIIFYKDTEGVYRGGNTAWAALVGKPLDQLVGKTDFDLFPADVAKSFQSYDKAMLASGKVLGVLGICHEITAPAGGKSGQEK